MVRHNKSDKESVGSSGRMTHACQCTASNLHTADAFVQGLVSHGCCSARRLYLDLFVPVCLCLSLTQLFLFLDFRRAPQTTARSRTSWMRPL